MKKLKEIERLRAVAVLMVMVVHCDAWQRMLPDLAHVPWGGVDVFFVISGYVVSLSFVKLLPPIDAQASFIEVLPHAKQALKTFYVRRFFRIMPPALAVMLCTRALAGAFPRYYGTTGEWWVEFFAFFGGIYNYVHPFHPKFHSGVYWSLAVEEHFYLILPILFLVFRTTNRRLLGCLGLAMFSILARAFMAKPEVAVDNLEFYEKFASHFRFDSLMAGVALALVSGMAKGPAIMPPRLMKLFILPMIIAVIACLPSAAPAYIMHHQGFIALWMLSGVLVAYAAMDRGYVLAFPVIGRFLEYIGSRSYALYLVHNLVIRLDNAERNPWPAYAKLYADDGEYPWRHATVLFVASLLAAEVLYRLVEQPFIRLGRRLIDGQPALSRRAHVLALAALGAFGLLFCRHFFLSTFGPRNFARGTAVYVSSRADKTPDPSDLTNGKLESSFGLCTKVEDDPWATIDLGSKRSIGAFRVYNRDDGSQDESIPLELEVSDDNVRFERVALRELTFTEQWPWRIRCTDVSGRYVRLQARKHAALCLSEVEMFESTTMAAIP